MPPARVPVTSIIGGSNVLTSLQAANERSINYFPETTKAQGKVQRYLRKAEGMREFTTLGASDTTGLFQQDGRVFAACGGYIYEIYADGTNRQLGAIAYDGTEASFCSNGESGHQLVCCSAGCVYVVNLDDESVTQVTAFQDAGVTPVQVEFMDGYVFALSNETAIVYYSAINNALTWDFTFGYIRRQWGSDQIEFIKRSGRQLWLVGSKTGEIWADNGNANVPFAPIQGAFLDVGCIARHTGKRDGTTLTWLSQDELGGGLLVRASGYDPERVSSPAIAAMLQLHGTSLAGATGFVHQMGGHEFYWLQVPGLDTTPVFDFTEGVWSERAMWNTARGVWEPHIARCHCWGFEKNLVGVSTSGVIYELSPTYRDNVVVTP